MVRTRIPGWGAVLGVAHQESVMSERAFRRKVEWSALVHGLESGKELELETQLFQRACVLCVRSLGASCPPQLKSFFPPPGASGRCPVSSWPLLPPQGGVPSRPGPCPVLLREVSRPRQGGVPSPSGRCPVSSRPLLPPQGGVPSLPGPCPVPSGRCPIPLREVSCHFPDPHFFLLLLREASASLTCDCVLSKPRLLLPYNLPPFCLLGF